jgi:cobalt-precorrin 5A hydrolase
MTELAIVALTPKGLSLASRLAGWLGRGEVILLRGAARQKLQQLFRSRRPIIAIMALGIVVRLLGPLTRDKRTEPAVVVVDEAGRFAISVLGGHEGGANDLAREVARALGACPVITTASDVVPRPVNLVLGVGCRRGVPCAEIEAMFQQVFQEHGLSPLSLAIVATASLKADEPGLQEFAANHQVPLRAFSLDELGRVPKLPTPSPAVREKIGIDGVAEPAALLAAGADRLLVPKRRGRRVTMAVAQRDDP